MLNLDISNLGVKKFSSLKTKLKKIKKQQAPVFENYREDFNALRESMKKLVKYDNIIVIGNGGSNTSFKAYHHALVPLDSKKGMFILTTMEPDLINALKLKFPRRKTLVMPISKSGDTVGILESTLAFYDYPIAAVTSKSFGALSAFANQMNAKIISHPPVGGRFSGLTASAFAPSLFFGIDIEAIDAGARKMYAACNPDIEIEKNPALQLAASLYLLEKKGYSEIFCPVYSSKLVGFENLIVQLFHESVCKKGRGQTIFCAEAPESQHHTNQRFFGGRKNVLGLFVTVEKQEDIKTCIKVPETLKPLQIRGGSLADINSVPYAKSLEFEFEGTYQDAIKKKIPCARISLDYVTPFTVGEFIAFWHYVAVYSAWLRDVDAFDQPQVESSKEISFRLRKEHRQ